MRTVLDTFRQLSAALRMLLVLTVILGVAYPLVVLAIGQLPGLQGRADGQLIQRDGRTVGSAIIGQSFSDAKGNPLRQYLQPRPSAATANVATGYDPTATSASNLGPESIVDTLPDPKVDGDTGTQSLLTQVCQRSYAVGRLDGVSGARPFCTTTGVGAVLAVFYSEPGYRGQVTRAVSVDQACPATPFVATYRGAPVSCMTYGEDVSTAKIVPVRGDAPSHPAVPADAVTASGSGLDPTISLAYARLQEARIARARGISTQQVAAIVDEVSSGRDLGFIGEPVVNVLRVNLALDATYPLRR